MNTVTPSSTKSATFSVTTAGANCNVLIDTGDSHSCMSENLYKKLMLQEMKQGFCFSVTSASGNALSPLETVQCSLKLGSQPFEFAFTICKNLSWSLILVLYIIQRHWIGLRWSQTGKGLLTQGKDILVETISICHMGPHIIYSKEKTVLHPITYMNECAVLRWSTQQGWPSPGSICFLHDH